MACAVVSLPIEVANVKENKREKSITCGNGCGSVVRAVASNNRGPWFESSHGHKFIVNIFTVNS